ncbi:unnamed protein product [Effrenium voratum]|nr:unnamed protein product [Effrenium voratum]
MLRIFALFGLALSETNPTGLSSCPCVEWVDLSTYKVGDEVHYKPEGQSTSYVYPLNYGSLQCEAHDLNLPPFCSDDAAPAWCTQKWCYVDPNNCQGTTAYRSVLFANSNAFYSYATCGESNEFTTWSETLTSGSSSSVTQLVDVISGYLWSTRSRLEAEQASLNASGWCSHYKQCPCLECQQNELWQAKADFSEVGVYPKRELFSCLSRPVAQSFTNIAAKEGQPLERIGYQYFSDHETGSYMGWPAVEWCLGETYDPRLRPWYSSGSTGPKDVVIVVDVSGSMQLNGRALLAKRATKAVIETLEWKDFATIILFNNGISAQYSQMLVPMFDAERKNALLWLEQQVWDSGGTNFVTAMDSAFNVISSSVSAGKTSMCQKAILFMTDGEAEFTSSDFARVKSSALQYSVTVFSYALGSGADATITKQLACDNRGIFYPVPDNADLASIMSRYYEYFASGVEMCSPSFTRYTDVVTGSELWPGCLPAYDRTGDENRLLGVSCFDLNVMVDIEDMKTKTYWRDFVCKLSDLTKQCLQLDTNDCRLEKLRRSYSQESVCINMDTSATCPCADPACQDDTNWLDELGYFCDTWVGDDCRRAAADWGYSAAGQSAVLQKCRRSCGVCPQVNPCPKQNQCSSRAAQLPSCRADLTDKVSPNGLQVTEIASPNAAPSANWAVRSAWTLTLAPLGRAETRK